MDIKLKWPILFKRFIDDGFGVMEGTKLDFEHWVSEFNLLRQTITIDKFKYANKVDFNKDPLAELCCQSTMEHLP